MNKSTAIKRLKKLRQEFKKKTFSCLVVTKPANVTYLTGFAGDDSWAVITKRSAYLLTDSRYTEQAQKQCPACKIIQRKKSLSAAAAKLVNPRKSVKKVIVEDSVEIGVFQKLKKNIKAKLKSKANLIEDIRALKDRQEIKNIEAAARIAAKALKKTKKYFKPGITENHLAGRLDFDIRRLGATNSFGTIVAFGHNSSRPHHQPGERKLKKNDTILIDFGVKYNGYCCDITRCFGIGNQKKSFLKIYRAVQRAQAAAIKAVKPGVKFSDVEAAAKKVLKEGNLPPYGHGTGHGLGLELHEKPFISKKSKDKVEPDMVFTIEPGVYIPGKIGIRIEDDVFATKTGCKILTESCPQLNVGK